MEIILTNHFKERCEQRYNRKIDFIIKTFEYCIKLVKKNKLFPTKGSEVGTLIIRYNDLKFIYSKKNGKYFLITFGKRDIL